MIPAMVFDGIIVANLFCFIFISRGNETRINPLSGIAASGL